VKIKGYGKVTITISVAKTSEYKAATKMVKLYIVPDRIKKFKVKANPVDNLVTFTWKKGNNKNAKCEIQVSKSVKFRKKNPISISCAMNRGILKNIKGLKLKKGQIWYFRTRQIVEISKKKSYKSDWIVRKVVIK